MAVHTTVVDQIMVTKSALVEVLHAALVYLQVIEYFVIRFYQSVSEIRVYAVFYDLPFEGIISLG